MMTRSQTNNNAYKVASNEAYNAAKAYTAYTNASAEAYTNASAEASSEPRRSSRLQGREPVLRRSARLNPKVDSHQNEDSHRSVPVHLVSSVQGKHLEPRRSNRLNPLVEPSVKMTIEEQEDDGVFIRRSARLVSQPKTYLTNHYFDLDNESDDEDYNPKYDMAVDLDDNVYVSSDKRLRPRSIPFEVDEDIKFDFDEASSAWRQNKRSIGNGMFAYRTRSSSK
jgi:hypothetical protein